MIKQERVVAIIPARGGSKTVPFKNIRPVGGKPLLAWPIDVAKATSEIDRVIVSTDDADIAAVGRKYGAEVADRPAELATDTALVIDTIRDLVKKLRAEGETANYFLLLEATCPLRSVEDVRECLDLLANSPEQYDSVATFSEASLNPHRAWKLAGSTPSVFIPGAIPWLPRQKLPEAYQLNGAVYAFRADKMTERNPSILVGKIGAVVTPRERAIDVDDEVDFLLVEAILAKGKKR